MSVADKVALDGQFAQRLGDLRALRDAGLREQLLDAPEGFLERLPEKIRMLTGGILGESIDQRRHLGQFAAPQLAAVALDGPFGQTELLGGTAVAMLLGVRDCPRDLGGRQTSSLLSLSDSFGHVSLGSPGLLIPLGALWGLGAVGLGLGLPCGGRVY